MKMLSIIVPVLNEAPGVAAALHALQEYRARQCELIVVDGGSTDGTLDLARPFADRLLVSPRGRGRQMNAGASAARGDILVFLHADTQLPAGADSLIRGGLACGKHAWGRFDADIQGRHRLLRVVSTMMNWRSRITGIATGDQAIFVTREAFRAAGGYRAQPLMAKAATH